MEGAIKVKKIFGIIALCTLWLGFKGVFDEKTLEFSSYEEIKIESLSVSTISDSDFNVAAYPYFTFTIINSDEKKVSVKHDTDDSSHSHGEIIVIPSTVTHNDVVYTVTEIAKDGFMGCDVIEEVTIPHTVTTINGSAFNSTTKLKTVTILKQDGRSNLTTIGSLAFSNTAIEEIDLSNTNLTTLGTNVFSKCLSLKSVVITNTNLTNIPAIFSGCTNLENIDFTNNSSLTSIETEIFNGYTKLHTVKLSSSILEIPSGAFGGCTSLTGITIPSSVTTIDSNAFSESGLTNIEIPSSVKQINNSAFKSCASLEVITFNKGLESISTSAFEECNKLTDIFLPNTLKSIGGSAFYNCNLDVLSIPESVTSIGGSAFATYNTNTLKVIYLNSTNIDNISTSAFWTTTSDYSSVTELCPIIVPASSYDSYVEKFSDISVYFTYEFGVKVNYQSGDISSDREFDEIIRLHDRPFNYIKNDTTQRWSVSSSFTIYSVLPTNEELSKEISSNYSDEPYTYKFDKYLLGNDVLSPTSIVTSSSVITAVFEAFFTVTFNYDMYEITGVSSLWDFDTNTNVVIPNYFDDGINGEHAVAVVTSNAFSGKTFKDLVIGNNVTLIESNAFDNCLIQGNVTLNNAQINAFAFEKTKFSNEVAIPERIVTITSNSFNGATFEKGIVFPSTLEKIEESAFENAIFNVVVEIPEGVLFIGNSAFASTSVTYFYLNDNSNYGSDVFKDAEGIIIASDKVTYEFAVNYINNDSFTYMIEITLDYDGGLANGKYTEVLHRLKGHEINYIMSKDLTWSTNEDFELSIPTKYGYIFVEWFVQNDNTQTEISLKNDQVTTSSIYNDDTKIIAIYNILELDSTVGEGFIEGVLESNSGFDIDVSLSISVANKESAIELINNGVDVYNVYSISLLKNGALYTPIGETFTVKIVLPEDMNKITEYTVYMIIDGEFVEIEATFVRGYITFTTDTLGDFVLKNEPIVAGTVLPDGSTFVKNSILRAILIMAVVNILLAIVIINLQRKKQKNIVAYSSIIPLLVLNSFFNQENIAYSILLALIVAAICQTAYIIYLILTRNSNLYVNQHVETVVTETVIPASEPVVTMENLEDLLEKSKEVFEKFADEDIMLEEYVEEDIEVFIDDEPIREMMNLDNLDDDTGEEREDDDSDDSDEEEEVRTRMSSTGQLIVIKFKKSFTARLNLTDDINKDFHTAVKNKLLSYKKINSRTSWHHEAYNFGRNQAAKMNVRGRTLFLYLPLVPADYEESKYSFKDCGHIKKYELLPFRVKIKSKRGLKYAFELIETVMANFETTERKKFEPVNYYQKNRGFEKLLKEGLIKELISSETYTEITETTEKIKTTKSNTDVIDVKENENDNNDGVLNSIDTKPVDENVVLKPLTDEDVAPEVTDDILSSLSNAQKEITDAIVLDEEVSMVDESEIVSNEEVSKEVELVENEPKKTVVETTQTFTTIVSTPTQTVSSTQTITPKTVTTELKPISNVTNTKFEEEDDEDDFDDIILFKPSTTFKVTQSVTEEVKSDESQRIVIQPFRPVDSLPHSEETESEEERRKKSLEDIYKDI